VYSAEHQPVQNCIYKTVYKCGEAPNVYRNEDFQEDLIKLTSPLYRYLGNYYYYYYYYYISVRIEQLSKDSLCFEFVGHNLKNSHRHDICN
jgi:hypothetical protein